MSSQCRSCRADIIWKKTESGATVPLDAVPVLRAKVERGLFAVGMHEQAKLVPTSRDGELVLHRSHFATCPNADQHRKPA